MGQRWVRKVGKEPNTINRQAKQRLTVVFCPGALESAVLSRPPKNARELAPSPHVAPETLLRRGRYLQDYWLKEFPQHRTSSAPGTEAPSFLCHCMCGFQEFSRSLQTPPSLLTVQEWLHFSPYGVNPSSSNLGFVNCSFDRVLCLIKPAMSQ